MKKLKLIIYPLFLLCFCSILTAQNMEEVVFNKGEKILEAMPDGVAISVALIKGEQVTYVGLLKEDGAVKKVELKDSLFEIGSITKIFTSTLLAQEVVDKRIKLNAKINKVFPFKFNDKIKLTYVSLANHSSGLDRLPSNILPLLMTNPNDPYSEYSYAFFDDYLKKSLRSNVSKHPAYAYSNLGAALLAYAISKKKAASFEDLLHQHIFEYYQMPSTAYRLKTSFSGRGSEGEEMSNWDFNAMKGAGGLVSSVKDLSTFVQAHFEEKDKALALSRTPTFEVSEEMSVALGWHILAPNTADEKYWHNGGTAGFTSSMSFRTSNQTGVVILSNLSALAPASRAIDGYCFELLDLLN